jgi:hypothetical protein
MTITIQVYRCPCGKYMEIYTEGDLNDPQKWSSEPCGRCGGGHWKYVGSIEAPDAKFKTVKYTGPRSKSLSPSFVDYLTAREKGN